jgi:hypothetical protein
MKFLDHTDNYQLRKEVMKVENSAVNYCSLHCIKMFCCCNASCYNQRKRSLQCRILHSPPYWFTANTNLLLTELTNRIYTLLSSLAVVNINDDATGQVLLSNSYGIHGSNAGSFRQCVCDAYNVNNKQLEHTAERHSNCYPCILLTIRS